MKETIYGWYPPARDVWKHYADDKLNSYDKEFFFKYGTTGFSSTNTTSRSVEPSSPAGSKSAAERTSRTYTELRQISPGDAKSPCQANNGVDRLDSASTNNEHRHSQHHFARSSSVRTPAKKWATRVTETTFTPPSAQSIQRPFTGGSLEQATPTSQVTITTIPTSPPIQTSPTKRAQSAVVITGRAQSATIPSGSQQRCTPIPSRSTKSAVPLENTSLTCRAIQPPQTAAFSDAAVNKPATAAAAAEAGLFAARQPTPPTQPPKSEVRRRAVTSGREELGVDNPLDYYEQLRKYGWKMEIPGDPLNLKRPCIAKRHPVYVQVEIPVIPPPAPIGHIDTTDTFFYNTIPRHRMAFMIHPDWPSEILHAKRMELQKRQGDRFIYRSNDFAFVY